MGHCRPLLWLTPGACYRPCRQEAGPGGPGECQGTGQLRHRRGRGQDRHGGELVAPRPRGRASRGRSGAGSGPWPPGCSVRLGAAVLSLDPAALTTRLALPHLNHRAGQSRRCQGGRRRADRQGQGRAGLNSPSTRRLSGKGGSSTTHKPPKLNAGPRASSLFTDAAGATLSLSISLSFAPSPPSSLRMHPPTSARLLWRLATMSCGRGPCLRRSSPDASPV